MSVGVCMHTCACGNPISMASVFPSLSIFKMLGPSLNPELTGVARLAGQPRLVCRRLGSHLRCRADLMPLPRKSEQTSLLMPHRYTQHRDKVTQGKCPQENRKFLSKRVVR